MRASNSPKKLSTWHFNLEDFRILFPADPLESVPEYKEILHYFATRGEIDKVFMPGTYQINEDAQIELACNIVVRKTAQDIIKLDLFSEESPLAETDKSKILEVTTITCLDLQNKLFSIKQDATRVCKSVNHATDSFSNLTQYMKKEVDNMREVASGKPRGPYLVNVGNSIHGFFTMLRIKGYDLFDYTCKQEFNTHDRRFEAMLRCLHAVDKYFHQRKKQQIDIKLDNFMVEINPNYPDRVSIKPIDLESMIELKNETTKVTRVPMCTNGYAPEELIEQGILSPTLEVYSLGIMFRLMISEKRALKFAGGCDDEITDKKIWHDKKGIHVTKFADFPELDVDVYQRLKQILRKMTARNPNDRCTFEECVRDFEALFISFQTSFYPGEENAVARLAMTNALQAGFIFARKTREYAQIKLGAQPETIERFFDELKSILRELRTKKYYPQEFLYVIEDVCLFDSEGIGNMLDVIKAIETNLNDAQSRWDDMQAIIEQTPNNERLLHYYRIHTQHIQNTPLTLDALNKLPAVIDKKLKHITSLLPVAEPAYKKLKH